MITFLTVNKAERKFLPFGNKISAEVKTAGGLSIKHIKCVCRGKKVPWEKIAKLSGREAGRLLVNEDAEIPPCIGIKPFISDELKARLCLNMAAEILRMLGDFAVKLRVAVYDPEGRIADGAGMMLKFTDKLTVVTRRTDIYMAEAQRLLQECGAVLNVSKGMKALEDARLVVAPLKLSALLPVSKESVVLTTCRPLVNQHGAVYFNYYFDLGEELMEILPEGFGAEYFASALYSLCGRYELGSIIPQAVKGTGTDHTLLSASKYLMNIASNT